MTQGEIEYRSSQLADVNYPKRTIELVVMPYESPAQVAYHGRVITEVCSRGAYDGVETRTSRIRVNRDHVVERTIGRTTALHPSREHGLVAEVRISKTELGEETLVLADDGVLDCSAGFALLRDDSGRVKQRAEVWESKDRRRLNHLWLDHIALTPAPAYESAQVLSVRQKTNEGVLEVSETPNLDRLELDRWQQMAAVLDRRYGLAR